MSYRLTKLGMEATGTWTKLIAGAIVIVVLSPLIVIYLSALLVVSFVIDTTNYFTEQEI